MLTPSGPEEVSAELPDGAEDAFDGHGRLWFLSDCKIILL